MLVARDPEDDEKRVLAAVKSNIAEMPESLSFRVVAVGGVPRVEWLGTTSQTADTLLAAAAEGPQEPSALAEAVEWLQGELAGGPRRSVELRTASRSAGLAWRTVERAKASLDVRARRADGAWAWSLRGDGRPLVEQDRQRAKTAIGGDEDSPGVSEQPAQDRQGDTLDGLRANEQTRNR